MAKKKKRNKSNVKPEGQNAVLLFFFCLAILLGAYLYGKVQIHVDLKKIDKMNAEIRTLKQKRDNLRIRVNALRGYHHVVAEAKKLGLVFVKSDKVDKIFVHSVPSRVGLQKAEKPYVCAKMML